MVEANVVVKNKLGIHARPAAMFVQTASGFESEISVAKDGVIVNGKSVMGMMMLAAERGSLVKISANGQDEAQALSALKKLFERKFDEE
ncbi:MAG: HPr family phosphocarrier protein [Elusimicrobia bacterium]|nr:HPr family phosphocarrier protein [Elusimicrobiota bacterium]